MNRFKLTCPIDGEALITEDWSLDFSQRTLRWERADPEIHVSRMLWDSMDEQSQTFFLDTYELGDECKYTPETYHARRPRWSEVSHEFQDLDIPAGGVEP